MAGDNDVTLVIQIAGDAPDKLRLITEGVKEAKKAVEEFSKAKGVKGTEQGADILGDIDAAEKKLKGQVGRERVGRAIEAVDPSREIRGPDPAAERQRLAAERRERELYNAALANQQATRKREAAEADRERRENERLQAREAAEARRGGQQFIRGEEASYQKDYRQQTKAESAARKQQEIRRRQEAAEAQDAAQERAEQDRLAEQSHVKGFLGNFIESNESSYKASAQKLAEKTADRDADVANRQDAARNRHQLNEELARGESKEQQKANAEMRKRQRADDASYKREMAKIQKAKQADVREKTLQRKERVQASGMRVKPPAKRGMFSGMGRFGRHGGRFLVFYAAERALEGMTKGLKEFSEQADRSAVSSATFSQGMRAMELGMAEGLPIIGGLFKAVVDFNAVTGGQHQQEAIGQRQRQQMRAGFALDDISQRGQFGVVTEMRQRQSEIASARIQSEATAGFANFIGRPGVAQYFNQSLNPDAAPYTTSAGLDTARLGLARQSFASEAASTTARQRRTEVDEANARIAAAEAQRKKDEEAAGLARNRREQAEANLQSAEDEQKRSAGERPGDTPERRQGRRKLRDTEESLGALLPLPIPGRGNPTDPGDSGGEYRDRKARLQGELNVAARAEGEAAGQVVSSATGEKNERVAAVNAVKAAEEAVKKEIQEQAKLKQSQVEVDKQRLELLKQERAGAESREVILGRMTKSERLGAAATIRQIAEHGYENASPEQKALYERIVPELAPKSAREASIASPESARVIDAIHQLPGGEKIRRYGEVDKEIQGIPEKPGAPGQPGVPGLAANITMQVAVNEAEATAAFTRALTAATKELEPLLISIVKSEMTIAISKDNRAKTIGNAGANR